MNRRSYNASWGKSFRIVKKYKTMTKYICLLFLTLCFACSPTPTLEDKLPELSQKIDEAGAKDAFSGVVLLYQNNELLLEKVYGLADMDTREPITRQTKFNLASMNKMFTAVAIMQLRDAGKLDLLATVGTYLSDYSNTTVRDSVTIQQLLTHTSGLGDYFDDRLEQISPDSIRSLNDYYQIFVNDPLNFAPGSSFGYSNAGYIVLGLVIEAITGRSYYDHIHQSVFSPLGMQQSGWGHSDTLVLQLARAYGTADSSGHRMENPYLGMKGSSAGGGFSTVDDLYTFAKGLKSGQILSLETLTEMKEDRFENGYGYGLSLRDLNGWKVYGHNGGFPGVSGEVDIFERDDLLAISLSNRGPRDGWAAVRTLIREAIVGKTASSASFQNAEILAATYREQGIDAARSLLGTFEDKPDERQLIHHSEKFNEQGDRVAAIDVLSLVIEAFPESWFPVSIKADLQMESGDTLAAIANWRKSLKLNPNNQWATDQLAKLPED